MTRKKPLWREYAEAIGIALVLALFIRVFVIQAFKIPSGSMIPTLLVGDHLLVNKFIYRFKDPRAGDVIVFKFPQDRKTDFIKRIVAEGGDRVELKETQLYVNGVPMEEPFTFYEDGDAPPKNRQFGPVVIPEGSVFVMGDNRDNSFDSRWWGPVDMDEVVGKAIIIYWSWGESFLDVRWERIGDLIR